MGTRLSYGLLDCGCEVGYWVEMIVKMIAPETVICFGGNVIKSIAWPELDGEVENDGDASFLLVVLRDDHPIGVVANIINTIFTDEDNRVGILVHNEKSVRKALRNGNVFFSTVYSKGVVVYSRDSAFHGIETILDERVLKREEYWSGWLNMAQGFYRGAKFYGDEHQYKLATYMLHQAVKHCCVGMIIVFTGYFHARSNNLSQLIGLCDHITGDFKAIFPRSTDREVELFYILLNASLYTESYKVKDEDVVLLMKRVEMLLKKVEQLCTAHLTYLNLSACSTSTELFKV